MTAKTGVVGDDSGSSSTVSPIYAGKVQFQRSSLTVDLKTCVVGEDNTSIDELTGGGGSLVIAGGVAGCSCGSVMTMRRGLAEKIDKD